MEQAILDYMRYGLVGVLWDALDEEGAGELLSVLKEAEGVSRVSELYEGHAREAVRLEETLERIESCLDKQKENWRLAGEALEDANGERFIRKARDMIGDLEKVPGLVEDYEVQADELAEKLKESRERFAGEEDLGAQTRQGPGGGDPAVRDLRERGRRAKEGGCPSEGKKQRQHRDCPKGDRGGQAVMDYINSWEPEEDGDDLDVEALWAPVRERWSRVPLLGLNLTFGIQDKETEGILERIRGFMEEGLLGLVLPEGTEVSHGVLSLAGLPSAAAKDAAAFRDPDVGVGNLLDRLMVCEYGSGILSRLTGNLPRLPPTSWSIFSAGSAWSGTTWQEL